MELDEKKLKQVMLKAAEAAAKETLAFFRAPLDVENKYEIGFDPVTVADKNAEKIIRDVISAEFPEHSIYGEELDDKITNSEYSWIIDPIDGTRAFISGLPTWGTLIGLEKNGKAISGLMSQPYIGEVFIAINGKAELIHKGKITPLKVSGKTKLNEAILFTTTPEIFNDPKQKAAFRQVENKVLLSRYGIDCYAYALLALGQIDLVIETDLKPCDIAPLIAIIENAGGIVSNWNGQGAESGGNIIAASSKELYEGALAIMNG